VTNSGADLHIEVTNATGQTLAADIARNDSRFRVLGQKNGLDLVQIMAGSAAFNLQVVTPASTNGASGEGSPVVPRVAIAPVVPTASIAAPVVNTVTPAAQVVAPEGESPSQPVMGLPTQALAPVTTSTTTTLIPTQTAVIPSDLLASSTGHSIAVAAVPEPSVVENDTTADETRAVLLEEVADEYGDPYRYGASSGSQFNPLEDELYDGSQAVEMIPAELLETLALAAAIA